MNPSPSPPRPQRLQRSADVIVRQLPDRTVLLNGSTGSCFELNRVGSLIWDQIDGQCTLEDIADRVADRFGMGPVITRADVERFAEALAAADLVRATP